MTSENREEAATIFLRVTDELRRRLENAQEKLGEEYCQTRPISLQLTVSQLLLEALKSRGL